MKLNQKLAINYIRARLNILALVSPRKAAVKAFHIWAKPRQQPEGKGKGAGEKVKEPATRGTALSFKIHGHTVRGHRWDPPGTPVRRILIAHGFESSSRNFNIYVDDLLQKKYEVLSFDAPAHGQSGGKEITLPLYVETLRYIYDTFGPVQSFFGHSFGGLALGQLIESIPHGEETRLALVAPASETTTAVDSFFRLMRLNEEIKTEMDRYIEQISGHPFAYYSTRRAMGNIRAKVLWLQDEEDRITPIRDALRVREDNHPNIRFVFTKGLGHRRIYRDPEIMRQIVEFL
jgi:pimeloyl-ACP methyl ester carboxylesterase